LEAHVRLNRRAGDHWFFVFAWHRSLPWACRNPMVTLPVRPS
jgi:hypothetical protein